MTPRTRPARPESVQILYSFSEPREGAVIELSVAFATLPESPDHIALAEELGYGRAWLYDTPHQGPDVWMTLALAAQRTERIGLGPGVLAPALRHPMVNATAAAALEQMAPGRLAVAFGTGFNHRRNGRRKPTSWAYVARYIQVFRTLLRGETAEWDGAKTRMLHPPGSLPPFPIEIPTYVGALGPKGLAVARKLGDGLVVIGPVIPSEAREFDEVAYFMSGTVLDDGEIETDERVRVAAGPGLMAQTHRGTYQFLGEEAVASLPGGEAWLEVVRRTPEDERHLTVLEGHLIYLNEADRAAWQAGAHEVLREITLTGTADEVRSKVERYASQGVTELVYQPRGEVERELRSLASAVEGVVA